MTHHQSSIMSQGFLKKKRGKCQEKCLPLRLAGPLGPGPCPSCTCPGSHPPPSGRGGITGPLSATQAAGSQQEGLVAGPLPGLPSLGSSSLEGLVKAFVVRDGRIHPRLESKVRVQKRKLFLLGSGSCARLWVRPAAGEGDRGGGLLEHV